ncbi:hypothetical protein Tcan_06819 [Toxocara canis]|uniref:Uncharacterized protein n=1 Tax=Toxocara canis TaxID=6265 RepID=A0A0B2VSY8_TOXCA|nr:hypothetical protein Tcan_06819 [Toxocara canis]
MIRRFAVVTWRSIASAHTSKAPLLVKECTCTKTTACLRTTCAPGMLRRNQVLHDSLRQKAVVDEAKCSLSTSANEGNETRVCDGMAADSNLPTKELLFQIDWLFEFLVPGFMKTRLSPFLDITNDDVIFEDKIFNYNFVGKQQLTMHIAKVRAYYRYLSPYNKVERLGSCIYEGEDVVVILWRLSSLRSNFFSYLPKLLTKRQDKMDVIEGAMDVHISKEGRIYKIVNRKITASDLEGAKVMAEMKKEVDEEKAKAERRKWARQFDEVMQDGAIR